MAETQDPDGVGIVVVSHSRALAEAALGLAAEMLHDRPVRIALAAGLDDATLGTDAVQVKQAIEAVDGPAGVLVLMDLGSAVMSAELALDLLEDTTARDRVTLSAAPIVEGLVVAAVTAAGGADRATVAAQADAALAAKSAHLSDGAPTTVPPPEPTVELVGTFTVINQHGLHARPAARMVAEMSAFDADVRLTNRTTGAGPMPADSMIQLALLGAEQGHELEVAASGSQARQALDRILVLAEEGFGEGG